LKTAKSCDLKIAFSKQNCSG